MCTSTRTTNNSVVIGGGAAGMMAAYYAAKYGAHVTLIEKNEKLGKKIYITGKGRCNLTNDCTLDEFLQAVPQNPRFLYAALNHLSPQDTMALIEDLGCPVKVERGRRVFPQSDKASDVTKALKVGMDRYGVRCQFNAQAESLVIENNRICGVRMQDGGNISCDAVIIATGGLSYPSTGSTGDGYRFAADTGHTLVPCCPSLTGFDTADAWTCALQGITLKNVSLSAKVKNKTIYHETGEMLFTHFGISGPLIIELSSLICDKDVKTVDVSLDLKPGLTNEQLDARFIREFTQAGKKKLSAVMSNFLPQRFGSIFPQLCHVDGEKVVSQISGQERTRLTETMKGLPLHLLSTRSYAEAIITRGGVSVKDVNASTMSSKRIKGLYFAGELLDVDAFTGGYNLQIAFSTGALAGMSAATQE